MNWSRKWIQYGSIQLVSCYHLTGRRAPVAGHPLSSGQGLRACFSGNQYARRRRRSHGDNRREECISAPRARLIPAGPPCRDAVAARSAIHQQQQRVGHRQGRHLHSAPTPAAPSHQIVLASCVLARAECSRPGAQSTRWMPLSSSYVYPTAIYIDLHSSKRPGFPSHLAYSCVLARRHFPLALPCQLHQSSFSCTLSSSTPIGLPPRSPVVLLTRPHPLRLPRFPVRHTPSLPSSSDDSNGLLYITCGP